MNNLENICNSNEEVDTSAQRMRVGEHIGYSSCQYNLLKENFN